MGLRAAPIAFEEAAEFVRQHHRHHTPPQGHKFSIAAMDGEKLVGVVIVGRPVARRRDDGATLEVTRLCTDGTATPARFSTAQLRERLSPSGIAGSAHTS